MKRPMASAVELLAAHDRTAVHVRMQLVEKLGLNIEDQNHEKFLGLLESVDCYLSNTMTDRDLLADYINNLKKIKFHMIELHKSGEYWKWKE